MGAALEIGVDMATGTDAIAVAIVGLEPDSSAMIRGAFESMFAQADRWAASAKAIKVTSVDQRREMKLARESRLALREIRINAEKARKKLKEDSVLTGKAIDGIANVLKALIEPIEAHLLEQETFAKRAEQARKDALREARTEALRAYGADPTAFVDLGAMAEETWTLTIEGAKDAHEARLEAEKQARAVRLEAERIAAERREAERQAAAKAEAERAEREKAQAEENARLRREAEEREAAARAEREAAAAERAKVEAEARAEREKARAEIERQNAELARVRAEKAAAEQAEQARQAAEEEARRAAELAPDREKLVALAAMLRSLPIPTLTTDRGQAAAAKVADQIAKMAAWVEKTGEAL